MKALVEFIARELVDHPEAVEVHVRQDERGLRLELRVAPEDVGKVIGRQGRIARALRTVVRAAALRAGQRVTVEIAR
ncbi:MAG: KH domain-containing protein [Armatimonadota bacterium]|nr:KH domain-containing protein [Armatimonadota bacterium]